MKSEVKLNTIQEKRRTYPCLVKGGVSSIWLATSPTEGFVVGHYDNDIACKLGERTESGGFDYMPLFEGSITLTND